MPVPEHLHLPGKAPVSSRGRHKIYVGMAAGVGKTTRALHELRDRVTAGEDPARIVRGMGRVVRDSS